MKKIYILFLLVSAISISAIAQKTELLHFYVEAGNFQRFNTPVSLDVEAVPKSDTLGYLLFEKVKGKLIEKSFQVEAGSVTRIWWILDGKTEAGARREFFLYSDAPKVQPGSMTTSLTKDNIILKKGSSEILNYRKSILYPPAGVDTAYKRSGFIHPMYSPSGNILTRISPRD
ncbi:MAG TPA: hypothetical protein PKI12_07350, partial [Bacteroidales bacterium]|nr:hypothetical protein [Bacteroidales bacterium]